jgi:dTDP-4-dehydrorhamnose reductase
MTRPALVLGGTGADGNLARLVADRGSGNLVVNCVGLIKQYIRDEDLGDRRRAIAVNADFPHALAEFASAQGFRIIHITTDCVFSGGRGSYVETDRQLVKELSTSREPYRGRP